MNKPIIDYPAAARAIALYLRDYCDYDLPYPNMIVDAARRANEDLEKLRKIKSLCISTETK